MEKIEKAFPNWEAIIKIVNQKFTIKLTPSSKLTNYELEDLASIISTRYNIANFKLLLGGLEATVNIFRKHLVFVSSFDDAIIALVVSKTVSFNQDSLQKFLQIVTK